MAPRRSHDREPERNTGAPDLACTIIEGCSAAISAFRHVLLDAARTDVPVVLIGETGTGKTTFAQALHALSPRRGRPFVRVDCPAGAGDLAEHARAAATGTLFLDDVTELSREEQSFALAIMQDVYTASGHPSVRVVTSAHPALETTVAAHHFRADLYYRLSVFEVSIPPLRERRDDIIPLARRFVERAASREGRAPPALPLDVEQALLAYGWPGNVAELMSVVERLVILAPGSALQVAALPTRIR